MTVLRARRTIRRWFSSAFICGASALFVSCATPPLDDPARIGPFFEPKNVSKDPTLGAIRRVVLVPIWAGAGIAEESVADLDAVFRQALQDQNRFEIVTLSRADCQRRFGVSSLSSAGALPHDFFPMVKRLYAADAVMFIDLTVFRAYHPLALGIRGRLAVVNNLRLVWSFDNVFSADDPTVSAAARNFYLKSNPQGVPADLTPSVLHSPSRFAAYAANTTFSTLPPVILAQFSETSSPRR